MERNEELTKSLVSLIDETLEELEELKKSKFSAAEIKIEGPGDKELAGKPANGELDAKKAEDDKEEEEDDKEEVEKGVLDEAEKAEDCEKKEDKEDDEEDKKIAQKEVDKHNEKKHGEPKDEDSAMKSEEDQDDLQKSEENEEDTLKKSLEEQETLMKSYVDSKFESLEKKVASLTEMIEQLADQPVERKGVPANVQALEKSTEEEETQSLSKTEVANKLFELKKSGTAVDTSDIIRVETGSATDVQEIAGKYNL
jgi:hypothetical protein